MRILSHRKGEIQMSSKSNSGTEKSEKKGLSKALKLFYGVGDCGFTLMTNVESYYFNFFLTNLAQFGLATVSFITTTASVIDACLSWIYGAILNSINRRNGVATVPG